MIYDQCGNSAMTETTVGVEEVVANFDFDYVGEFGLQLINNSVNGSQFLWEFDDGDISTAENPSHSFLDMYQHEIVLYVQGELGCIDSISDWFIPMMNIYVPNTFTPNNDGINDVFQVQGHDVFTYTIYIFDRWGEIVFESRNIDEVWDGSKLGSEYYAPDGVYQYFIKAVGLRENGFEQSGTVTLMR
ncbi:MAG: gliding motility-associated C-terminal domain-containing protein [Flavobacteriales bacterium]|nr:gliding motility-associated C-terminal domain-containing protein [Flavobacteriales bacterium]